MGKPMDYGPVASTYAAHRWALEWKLVPLLEVVATLSERAVILEVGCGTGDYLYTLHERAPRHDFRGFDISPQMVAQARSRCPWATFETGSATERFPADSGEMALVYAVDVLHHLEDHARFFEESARVLRNHGRLVVITDSEEDIRARSMAELFPTTVPINLARYPAIDELLNWGQGGIEGQGRKMALADDRASMGSVLTNHRRSARSPHRGRRQPDW